MSHARDDVSELTVRAMRVEDFAQVYELGLRCYDVLDKPYNYWSIREVADHLENNPSLCFVAEADGVIAGFALADETFELIDDTGHLEWVAVAPEFRRQGVASRLITAAADALRAAGKHKVVTDIASDNPASRAMAAQLGFTEGISVAYFEKELR
jgi:ribosomal protein S18 acetylase RimI-like enzyme